MQVALAVAAVADVLGFLLFGFAHAAFSGADARTQPRVGVVSWRNVPPAERQRRRRNLLGVAFSVLGLILFVLYESDPLFSVDGVGHWLSAVLRPVGGATTFDAHPSLAYVLLVIFLLSGGSYLIRTQRRVVRRILPALSASALLLVLCYFISSGWALTWWGDIILGIAVVPIIFIYVTGSFTLRVALAGVTGVLRRMWHNFVPWLKQVQLLIYRLVRWIGQISDRLEPVVRRVQRWAQAPERDGLDTKVNEKLRQAEEDERREDERGTWDG